MCLSYQSSLLNVEQKGKHCIILSIKTRFRDMVISQQSTTRESNVITVQKNSLVEFDALHMSFAHMIINILLMLTLKLF